MKGLLPKHDDGHDGVGARASAKTLLATNNPSLLFACDDFAEPRATLLGSRTWSLHQHALTSLGSHAAKLHWIRSAFSMAARKRCYRK